jgi:hypothetical protein
MKIAFRSAAGVATGALLVAGSVALKAQNASDLRVYKGESVAQVGVRLLPWGSGDAVESEEKVFVGNKSIKVTTHGRYQGARLVLQNPLDLKSVASDPTAYLLLTIALANRDSSGSMGIGGDYGGIGGAMGRMMQQGMRGRGGPGGPGGPPGGGYPGAQGGEGSTGMNKQKAISKVRVVLATTDNKKMEAWMPLESAVPTRDEWKQLAVPVSKINGLAASSGAIKEVQIFGDTPAILYVGEVRVMRDETPIRVDDLPERTVAVNDAVQFVGSADGGVTPLVYEWDFDNQDGVAPDKDGKVVTHRFRKSRRDQSTMGRDSLPYIVTLTVRDPYGIKKPATRTTKVLVTL